MASRCLQATDCQRLYSQIDQEINAHYETIRQLRTRRNSLSSICRLPPEVLTEMFTYVTPMLCDTARDILNTTHVCHHWREVALAFPRLWSTIKMDRRNPSQIRNLMLARAKHVPLTFVLNDESFYEPRPALFDELSQQTHRTRCLSLEMYGIQNPDAVAAVNRLVLDATILEHFRLYESRRVHSAIMLPRDFLGNAPRLRSLGLSACVPPWDSLVFRGLTHLELSSLYNLSPTAEELWAVLRGSPALEDITFEGILQNLTSAPSSWNSDTGDHIILQMVHHISIRATDFISYAQFFTQVRIPADVHLDLYILTHEDGLPNGLTMFPSIFFASIRADVEPAYTFSLDLWPGVRLVIYKEQFRSPERCDHQLGLSCGRRITAYFRGLTNPFSSFCHDSPFTAVHTFILNAQYYEEDVPWPSVLAALPRLRVLDVQLDRSNYMPLMDALTPLAELEIPISDLHELRLSSNSEAIPSSGTRRLITVLDKRVQANTRIDTLTCTGILIRDPELERLKQMVRTVNAFGRWETSQEDQTGLRVLRRITNNWSSSDESDE